MQDSDPLNIRQATRQELIRLLEPGLPLRDQRLFEQAYRLKVAKTGPQLHLRFLLEFSNVCSRDCLYCGIRRSNFDIERYSLPSESLVEAVHWIKSRSYRNIVLQAGERSDRSYTRQITRLIEDLRKAGGEDFRIVLSLGEQSSETYRDWKQAGADRYLLRIETSNPKLYSLIHPSMPGYTLHRRLRCLEAVRQAGFQTGTGVMIGLPFQSLDDLAADLLFLKAWEPDMVGMGPYIEHYATPLYAHRDGLPTPQERYWLSLRMIALLRCLLPEINIVASTALQSLYMPAKEALQAALLAGANVCMPNLTPLNHQQDYALYDHKYASGLDLDKDLKDLAEWLKPLGASIALDDPGDPPAYHSKKG